MDARLEVVAAAQARAEALGDGNADRLTALLHPEFRWTTHTGRHLDRDAYLARNCGGPTVWRRQRLVDPEVVVVGDVAVLRSVVEDEVESDRGPETFRMPVTQVWVRADGRWRCLAGHAGPRTG